MSKLSDDLIQSLKEAVAHAKRDGPGTEHVPKNPRAVSYEAEHTEAKMDAPMIDENTSDE